MKICWLCLKIQFLHQLDTFSGPGNKIIFHYILCLDCHQRIELLVKLEIQYDFPCTMGFFLAGRILLFLLLEFEGISKSVLFSLQILYGFLLVCAVLYVQKSNESPPLIYCDIISVLSVPKPNKTCFYDLDFISVNRVFK